MFVAFSFGQADKVRKVYVSADHVTVVVPASNVSAAHPGRTDIHLMGGQTQRVNESADEVVAKLAKYLDEGPMAPPSIGSVDI
jgi:hypothetical protein